MCDKYFLFVSTEWIFVKPSDSTLKNAKKKCVKLNKHTHYFTSSDPLLSNKKNFGGLKHIVI